MPHSTLEQSVERGIKSAVDGKPPVLSCTDLVKTYGDRQAVNSVSFSIREKECYGLLGPNGAGKTTTMSIACGLLRPDSGLVEICGRPAFGRHSEISVRQLVGYVPQDVALYPELSVVENLEFFAKLYGLGKNSIGDRVKEVLSIVGLADRRKEKVGTFSGGMKRRANIAAGLIHEPKLLMLDEPTVGVDPQSRYAILETVKSLTESGMAVLYTTHYMEEAARLCDHIGIIDEGRLVAQGSMQELIRGPRDLDRIRLTSTKSLTSFASSCEDLEWIESITIVDETGSTIDLLVKDGMAHLPLVVRRAHEATILIRSAEVVDQDLESVFLTLTGKELRD